MNGAFRYAPPTVGHGHLLRPRLIQRLDERWERRLTVVVGGAGFGKSTLLAQALRENALAPRGRDLWIGCQPGEDDQSLRGALLELCKIPPRIVADASSVVSAVIDSLWASSPMQIAIVLDDFHHVTQASPAASLVQELLDALPLNAHLVLASRTPPVVATARLVSQGEVAWVEEHDLLFGDEELKEFADRRDVPVAILDRAGGWPALAELRAAAGKDLTSEFLYDEVLSHLSAERRRWLALAACVGGMDDEIATAVTGHPRTTAEVFDGVPLVHESEDGRRYLHPLWQTALADAINAVEAAAAKRAAARVLVERGELELAFDLLVDAGDEDALRSLVREVVVADHFKIATETTSRWVTRLPEALRATGEGALLAATVALAGSPQAAVEPMEAALHAFAANGDEDGQLACLVQLGYVGFWAADLTIHARAMPYVFALEAAGNRDATVLAAASRAAMGLFTGATQMALEVLDAAPAPQKQDLAALIRWLRSRVLLELGRLDDAITESEPLIDPARPRQRLIGESTRGLALWYKGRLAEAIAVTRWGAAHAEPLTGVINAAAWANGLASMLLSVGDVEEARPLVRRAAALYGSLHATPLASSFMAQAALALADGDEQGAVELVRSGSQGRVLSSGDPASIFAYVLLPEMREEWDGRDLSETHAVTRDLAQALVAVREESSLTKMAAAAWPGPDIARSRLSLPWSVDIAVALDACGRPEGRELLDAVGLPGRARLRELTTSSIPKVAQAARRLLGETPSPPEESVEVRVLGALELLRGGQVVKDADWRRERVRLLLLFLIEHQRPTREEIGAALWPDLDETAVSHNLRVTLAYLLKLVEPDRPPGDPSWFVRQEGRRIWLHRNEHLVVDAWDFAGALEEAETAERDRTPSVALGAYRRAVALYRGDYMADAPYEEWVTLSRDWLRSRFVVAAARAGELALATGEPIEAAELAQRALQQDRWCEPAYRLSVAAHLAQDQRGLAVAALQQCRQHLLELGAEPTEETLMLERLLLSASSGAPAVT